MLTWAPPELFFDVCLPRLYREINSDHIRRPAFAATLDLHPHYGQFVQKIDWELLLDIYFPSQPATAYYLPSEFLKKLQPLITTLRRCTELASLDITPIHMVAPHSEEDGSHTLQDIPQLPLGFTLPNLRCITMTDLTIAPHWSVLFWLISASPASAVHFIEPFDHPTCAVGVSKWTNVTHLSLSAKDYDRHGSTGSPSAILDLCPALQSLAFDLGSSTARETVVCRRGFFGRSASEPDTIGPLQVYLASVAEHPPCRQITRLSLKNLEFRQAKSRHLALRQYFPAATYIKLHYAVSCDGDDPTELNVTLANLFDSPRRLLSSLDIVINSDFHEMFKEDSLPCTQLLLLKDERLFPNLQYFCLELRMGTVEETVAALAIPMDEEVVESIQQVLQGDFDRFVLRGRVWKHRFANSLQHVNCGLWKGMLCVWKVCGCWFLVTVLW